MRITPSLPTRRLTPAQHEKVTRASKELALFAALQVPVSHPPPKRDPIRPGTAQFTATAKREYELQVRHFGKAQLPSSFRLRAMSKELSGAVDSFTSKHGGHG